jgi:hypothetical protein
MPVKSDLAGTVLESFEIGLSCIYSGGRAYFQLPANGGKIALYLNSEYEDWNSQQQYFNGNIVRRGGGFWIAQYGSNFTGKDPETEPFYWSPYAFPTYPDDGVGLLGEIKAWHKNFYATTQTPLITSTTYSSGNVLGNLKDTSQNFLPANTHIASGMLHINYASGNAGIFANVDAITDNNNLSITGDVTPGNSAPYKLYNSPVLHSSWVECNGQVCNTNGSVFYGKTIPNLNKQRSGEKTPGQTLTDGSTKTNRQMVLYGNTASGVFSEFAFRAKQPTDQWLNEKYNLGPFSVVYIMRVML